MTIYRINPLVTAELNRARALYPEWPDDILHQAAIVAEESGEVVKACLDYVYHNGSKDEICTELVQVIAMCTRMLEGR